MTIVNPTLNQKNLYANFCHYLNRNGGQLDANDALYYNFLDQQLVKHEDLVIAIKLCVRLYPGYAYVLHKDGRVTGVTGGSFYLTKNGFDILQFAPDEIIPPIVNMMKIEDFKPKAKIPLSEFSLPKKKEEKAWTAAEVVNLLTNEAHMVGRMLGTGYDLLDEIHGEWISNWIANPNKFRVVVHQGHRDSYKTSSLRLALAIWLILEPKKTFIVIRKSEDAVKEIVNGVSKILDTPLFQNFINILYPDIKNKGGFKKTTDTALTIDTNLNVSLSGEYQLRALGLGSPLTGKHSSIIITDDICTTADRESDAERRATISKYQEMMNLLSNNKGFSDTRIINIGTPWHEEDVFSLMERGLKDKTDVQKKLEDIPLKDRTKRQKQYLRELDKKRGKFIYDCYETGLMTDEDIEWKKKVLNDDVLFTANYLLSLVSDDEKPFPRIKNVGNYSKSQFAESDQVFAHIDAKYSGQDTCALTIGSHDWETNHTIIYGRLWKISIDQNYIELAEIMEQCGVDKLFIESNTDKGLMGDRFRGLGFDVESYHESLNKHVKIVSTIRPFWREENSEDFPSVQFVQETEEEYLSQVHNYKKGVSKDDAPDSLASLILRSKFEVMPVGISWVD